ncbi:MAG TPA: aminomethyl-transferring glycine dehydrogenase subunit GcvPA [Trueperaceae bacterium]|nr:aminomethyl-transferring glycine dehydrogenase subunit GcvPA [Trueperaceae bacterium]
MPYLPHSADDVRRALETIGVDSIDALFDELPSTLRNPDIDLPPAMDETTLMGHLRALAAKDVTAGPNFLGGGMRRHFIPAVTPALALQSEFVTAYTPYQPEVAQGVLQATFEFQTMMSELTGLDVANASMYDGATAVAEAALLAVRQTRRETVLVSRGVHPETRDVLATYLEALEIAVHTVDLEAGRTPPPGAVEDAACVIAQQPNHLGLLEDMGGLAEAAHAAGALFVAAVDPLSLAVLKPPGVYGADVAVGDGQVLGNPMAFGGPSFGFMVVRTALLRQLPGRLVGQTTDVDGKRAFVLTLQAREQHIRRSKAKSNICSNHQLTALMATVNMAALGPEGLREMAVGSVRQAHRLLERLRAAGAKPAVDAPFFNEFPLATRRPGGEVRSALAARGVQAGVPLGAEYGLGNAVLLCATELVTDRDIETLIDALRGSAELDGVAAHHG